MKFVGEKEVLLGIVIFTSLVSYNDLTNFRIKMMLLVLKRMTYSKLKLFIGCYMIPVN